MLDSKVSEPCSTGVATTELYPFVTQKGRIWHIVFVLDQNYAFLKDFDSFICHVMLVLNFLHFLVGKGDFCPGICWFEIDVDPFPISARLQ